MKRKLSIILAQDIKYVPRKTHQKNDPNQNQCIKTLL